MRTLRFTLVATLLLAAFAGVGRAAAAPAAAGAPWPVAATLGLGLDDVATSCPTVDVCVAAAGGELVSTSDGGATWTRRTASLPTDVAAVADLDCPAVAVCHVLVRRADGTGAVLSGPPTGPFTAHDVPVGLDPEAGPASIACPGRLHCLVTDGRQAWTTRDGAATWTTSTLPRFVYSDAQVTCVDATNRCVVYGNAGLQPVVLVTANDGGTWTVRDPGPFSGLYALDCPTVSVCVAGGRGSGTALIRRSTDGGATWQFAGTPGQPYGVRSISCATATDCAAFGLTPGDLPYAWTTTTGTSWAAQAVTAAQTDPSPDVDCPAVGVCRAAAGGIAYVTDDGATWSDRSLPAVTQTPRAISCPRASACVAVGVDTVQRPLALTSTDSGRTWTPHPLPATVGQPTAVDCVPGTRTCVLVAASAPPGNGRTVVRGAVSTDLGATWTVSLETNVVGFLRSVSCPTTTMCLAGGYDRHSGGLLWRTTDGARTWRVVPAPAGMTQDNTVSCAAATSCVVVSNPYGTRPVALTTRDFGATWQQRVMPGDSDNATYYSSVDCAETTCVAVGFRYGDDVIARSVDGGVWQRVTPPGAPSSPGTVSCASALVCAATGFDFRDGGRPVALGTRDGGVTWTVHPVQAGKVVGGDISCAGNRCYVPQAGPLGNPIVVSGAP